VVRFEINTLARELSLIRQMASEFLDAEGAQALYTAEWALRGLPRNDPTASWVIETPVTTRRSCGEYAQDGQGEFTVIAKVTSVWEVTRLDQHALVVRDNVSTCVSIETTERELARWTMDMAAISGAPGCGLHAQVKHHPNWYPEGFDVPRVPVFIPTVGAVLEFVLGELFQREWAQNVSAHKLGASWRELQQRMWGRWLSWQHDIVRASAVSPWLDIKAAGCAGL
jgi:hypothetical protein